MKTETTISKINSDLIQTFASLDAWFDKVLEDDFGVENRWSMRDVVQHIVTSNSHLLDLLSEGYDYAWLEFARTDQKRLAQPSLDVMRFALREQLFHCLCLLDEQELGDEENETKEMNVYDKLSSVINHLHYHLQQLEDSEKSDLVI